MFFRFILILFELVDVYQLLDLQYIKHIQNERPKTICSVLIIVESFGVDCDVADC